MQILCLLGMYFDGLVVEVKTFLLLFRLALAIPWDFWEKKFVGDLIWMDWFSLPQSLPSHFSFLVKTVKN